MNNLLVQELIKSSVDEDGNILNNDLADCLVIVKFAF